VDFMMNTICVTSQVEGSEVSAELEFLNQQNLILSMENKALKQRLESLAQEQLIKYCKLLSLSN
jgi:regulator of replication initiation timing